MAPKKYVPRLTADSFEEQYGALVREQYSHLRTPRLLRTALAVHRPAINVSDALLKVWFLKSGMPGDAVKVESAADLQEHYGDLVLRLSVDHPSSYLLCKALRAQQPPLYVTDSVCKHWLRTHASELEVVHSAGRLELKYGDQLRSRAVGLSSAELRVWLRQHLSVDCDLRVCETWRCKDWSTSSKILSIQQLEQECGDKLRLPQYEASFQDVAVEAFAQQLREHDPPVDVSSILLAQWHAKYHHNSGPLQLETAQELEEQLGDVLRLSYSGLGSLRDLAWGQTNSSVFFHLNYFHVLQ